MTYPLGWLADEAALITERVNGAMITEANLLQYAVHGVLSEKSRKVFNSLIAKLTVKAETHRPPEEPFDWNTFDDEPEE